MGNVVCLQETLRRAAACMEFVEVPAEETAAIAELVNARYLHRRDGRERMIP